MICPDLEFANVLAQLCCSKTDKAMDIRERLYKSSLQDDDDRMKLKKIVNQNAHNVNQPLSFNKPLSYYVNQNVQTAKANGTLSLIRNEDIPNDFKPYFFADALLNVTEGTYTWYHDREGPLIECSDWVNFPNWHPYEPNVEKWIFLRSYCDDQKNSTCLKYVFLTYTNCLTLERAEKFDCDKKEFYCESDLEKVIDG